MMKRTMVISVIMLSMLATSPVWGHGTEGYTEAAAGVLIKAEYDDGEPMSYAAVEITAPEKGAVFQKGRTDRNGVFMFLPDQSGNWKIIVSDAMGHRLKLGREIVEQKGGESERNGSHQMAAPPVSQRQGVMTGIAIIFGLSGMLYGWKVRRSPFRK